MKKVIALCAAAALVAVTFTASACAESESYALSASRSVANGSIILTQTQAKAGEKIRLACLPDAGYSLKGYTVNGEHIDGCAFIMPAENVEISAEFEVIEYEIEYVLNGCSVAADNPVKYTVEDGEIMLNAPFKDGYEFCYWYAHFYEGENFYAEWDDYKVEKLSAGTFGKLTLYAKYYNVPHNVNVDDAEYSIWITADSYYALPGETVTLTYGFYSDNYEFVCFTVDGENIDGDSFVMPNRDVEVSAKVKPVEYSITYELDGGVNSPENPASYTVEDEIIFFADPVKEGYVFAGWYLDDAFETYINYAYDDSGMWLPCIYGYEASDIILYALFELQYEE